MTGADLPSPAPPLRARTLGLAVCAAVILTGLVSSWPSIGRYWNMDDLHLVRTYSGPELVGTLSGEWDPDGIETPGWRPLTTLFNHARAAAFGESVVAHRLFLLTLYGVALAFMGHLLRKLGAGIPAVLMGAVLAVGAKNSYYHYVWIADGVHVLQLLFSVLALGAGHRFVEDGARRPFAVCLGWFAAAMLTREDSLAILPAMFGLSLGFQVLWTDRPAEVVRVRLRRLVHLGVAFAIVLPVWWMLRLAVVSNAPNVKLDLATFDRVGEMLRWTVSLVGGVDPLWPLYGALAFAALLVTRRLPPTDRRLARVLLASALLACVIGDVRARANLVILPAMFYGFFLGVVATGAARWGRGARVAVAIVSILAVGGAVRASRLEQQDLHPMSAGQIARDWTFISGRLGEATIPAVRREVLEPKLAAFGLLDPAVDINAWRRSVLEAGRLGPQPDGGVFVAARSFLESR